MKRVAVIGGGVTGLAAAYYLERRTTGLPLEIELHEASSRLGGKIVTERRGPFLIEGGPDSFIALKPQAARLCRDLGLGEQLVGTRPEHRETFVLRGGGLHPFPEGMLSMIPTQALPVLKSGLLSLPGKLRLMAEPLLPRGGAAASGEDDEALGAFMRRRFGDEFYEAFAEPVFSGIFSGDPDRLSLRATFPRFLDAEREHGSVVLGLRRAAAKRPPASGRGPASVFQTLRGGLGGMIDGLRAALERTQVHLGSRIESVSRREDGGFLLHSGGAGAHRVDAVMLATPAGASSQILHALCPPASQALMELPFGSAATVTAGFRRDAFPAPPRGYGFVAASGEDRLITAATWSSNKWDGRADDEHVLVRLYYGERNAAAWTGLDDAELARRALEDLARVSPFTRGPEETAVYRWPGMMPIYALGHERILERIEGPLRDFPNLKLAGSSYRGAGIPDCVADADAAAQALVQRLGA